MKTNEILFRQNRVVYTLMILLAVLGLFWSLWEHQHRADSTPHLAHPTAASATSQNSTWTRKQPQ